MPKLDRVTLVRRARGRCTRCFEAVQKKELSTSLCTKNSLGGRKKRCFLPGSFRVENYSESQITRIGKKQRAGCCCFFSEHSGLINRRT